LLRTYQPKGRGTNLQKSNGIKRLLSGSDLLKKTIKPSPSIIQHKKRFSTFPINLGAGDSHAKPKDDHRRNISPKIERAREYDKSWRRIAFSADKKKSKPLAVTLVVRR